MERAVRPVVPAGRKSKLTKRLIEEVCALVRAGAFDWVAAGAAGISRTTFYRWLQEAQLPKAGVLKREFRDQLELARCEARAAVEIRVNSADPKFWLRNGPGKTRKGQPGWTDPMGEAPVDGETGDTIPIVDDGALLAKMVGIRDRLRRERSKAEEATMAQDGAKGGKSKPVVDKGGKGKKPVERSVTPKGKPVLGQRSPSRTGKRASP